MVAHVHFLGTGGGRFSMILQRRWTGGVRLVADGINLHVDPGPGALVRSLQCKLSPLRINAVAVSHAHPDHYCDAEVLIEAMSSGGTRRRGVLIGPRSVMDGNEVCEPAISRHHQAMPKMTVRVQAGQRVEVGGTSLLVTKALHSDPDAVGFRVGIEGCGDVGYTSDTEYFGDLPSYYAGVRVLIACSLRPRGAPWKYHLSTDDVVKLAEEVKPELVVLTHFGAKMLRANPATEAKFVEEATGVKTVAATDGMRVSVADQITISPFGRDPY